MMPEAPEARKKPWKRVWKGVNVAIRLAIAAGILVFLFHKIGGEEIWDAFRRFHWLALAAAVAGYCCMQAIKAHRLQILLGAIGVPVSYARLLGVYFIGMFFNTVLPTIVGGDAVRVVYLSRETGKVDRAVVSVLTERAIGVGALIAIAMVAVLVSGEDATPVMVYLVLAFAAAFVVGMVFLFSPWLYRAGTRCMRALGLGKMAKMIAEMQTAFGVYRRRYGVLVMTALVSLVVEVVMIGLYMLLAYGLGLRLPIGFFFIAVPITVLVSMAPVTISGLGVREVVWVFFLRQQGLPEADGVAVALSLMWFATATIASMFGGPVFLFWRAPVRAAARPTPTPIVVNGGEDALDHV